MRSFKAFIKKEFMAQFRSCKPIVLALIFALLGFMNPGITKMTPWLMDVMKDALAETGMSIVITEVSAMDSWAQFFKNMPMGLIAFILLEGNIFTREYHTGTLILSLTKGLDRYKVVISKACVLALFWTVVYWLCFWITYGCNAYFWDNSVARHIMLAGLGWWLFGIMVVALMVVLSVMTLSNIGVLMGTGGVIMVSYIFSMLPKIGKYSPTYITEGYALVYGVTELETYLPSLIVVAVITVACIVASVPIFNKKQL